MTLETFFDNFALFTDAPDAVAKMRELMLGLAVQGKLVEQKAAEGDADALLEAIAIARKNYVGGKASEEVETEVEGWHQVPASWRWVRLRTIGDIVGGGTPRSDNSTYFAEDGIPWLTPADLNGFKGKRILRGRRCITKAGLEESSARLLPAGSVLFSSRAPIGYVAIAGTELATNQGFKSCVPFIRETNEFLYYYLMSAAARVDREASGTTFREVSGKIVSQLPVPLPPLAEQKRIVAKVDELMALCDQLETQQQERETQEVALARASLARFAEAPTPTNLEWIFHSSFTIRPSDLRKSILTLAVQGKLVPQDSNDEPAKTTLARMLIAREHQEQALRIKKPSPVEADADHMPDLPSGWCYASPDQLTAFHKNALAIGPFGSSLLKSDYADEGVPLVFVRDIRSEAFGGPETRFVTPEKANELTSHTVRPGDLLITKMGAPPGDTAIYPEGRPPAIITADCIKLTPHADVVSAEYLRFTIRASQIAEQFAGITLGVAQQKVSLGRFRCIAIPLPPLDEQRRIVAKVDELMASVDALETQLATARTTAALLLAAAVAELTNGEDAHAAAEV